jgi:hypothetical protein
VRRERRKDLTRREWRLITSRRPVLRRIPPPEKSPPGERKHKEGER